MIAGYTESMRRWLALAVLLPGVCPAVWGAIARASLPSVGLSAAVPVVSVAPAAFSITAALPVSLPAALDFPAAQAPGAAGVAPSAAAPARPLVGTGNGVIMTSSLEEGVAELRLGSHEIHPEVAKLIAQIKAARPELPISTENLFMVKDRELLLRLGLPEEAAGAARILSDGRQELPVIILVAVRGVSPEQFIERAVHEAQHILDDGILRVGHNEDLKHFFAEGWTQRRALAKANEILAGLGRPTTSGGGYSQEVSLADVFTSAHGTEGLEELVRSGSDEALRRALGSRWTLAARLASSSAVRERRLNALIALVTAASVGPAEERQLLDYLGV